MPHSFLSLACHLYAVAALVYLTFLWRQRPGLALAGRILVGAGSVLHAVALGLTLPAQGGMPAGMAQGFSILALVVLAIFLWVDIRQNVPVMGAFLTPFATAVLLPGLLLTPTPHVARVVPPLLPVHITIALVGLAAFAAAASVAALYLLMERQAKGKKFGLLFTRLPSLQFLDELSRRLVVGGFIALSVTLVTGAFFVSAASGLHWQWTPKEIATAVAWSVFAAVLNARFFAGWQGRKVAVLTMAGFCILLVSFFTAYPAVAAP